MVGLIGMLAGEVIFETVRFSIMLILLVAALLLGGKLRGISDKKKEEKKASPKINFVVSTYYKGTGIEQLTKKLEEYVDTSDKSESQINYI